MTLKQREQARRAWRRSHSPYDPIRDVACAQLGVPYRHVADGTGCAPFAPGALGDDLAARLTNLPTDYYIGNREPQTYEVVS